MMIVAIIIGFVQVQNLDFIKTENEHDSLLLIGASGLYKKMSTFMMNMNCYEDSSCMRHSPSRLPASAMWPWSLPASSSLMESWRSFKVTQTISHIDNVFVTSYHDSVIGHYFIIFMTLSSVLVGFILIQFYYPVNLQLLFIANLKHKYIKEDQKKTKVPSLLRYMIRYDFISKPGRQIVTFLILCNFGLWITYNFEIQKVIQCNIICRENNDFSGKCHS